LDEEAGWGHDVVDTGGEGGGGLGMAGGGR
jgi:hypothetical protein